MVFPGDYIGAPIQPKYAGYMGSMMAIFPLELLPAVWMMKNKLPKSPRNHSGSAKHPASF